VQLDRPAGDGKAQPGAAADAGQAAAVEPLEDVLALVRRYARPFVGHLEHDRAAGRGRAGAGRGRVGAGRGEVGGERDDAVGWAVGGGVVEQVRHHLVQPVAVAADAQRLGRLDREPGGRVRDLRLGDGRGQERRRREDRAIERVGARVQP